MSSEALLVDFKILALCGATAVKDATEMASVTSWKNRGLKVRQLELEGGHYTGRGMFRLL